MFFLGSTHILSSDFFDFLQICGAVGDHYDVERVAALDFILLFY